MALRRKPLAGKCPAVDFVVFGPYRRRTRTGTLSDFARQLCSRASDLCVRGLARGLIHFSTFFLFPTTHQGRRRHASPRSERECGGGRKALRKRREVRGSCAGRPRQSTKSVSRLAKTIPAVSCSRHVNATQDSSADLPVSTDGPSKHFQAERSRQCTKIMCCRSDPSVL